MEKKTIEEAAEEPKDLAEWIDKKGLPETKSILAELKAINAKQETIEEAAERYQETTVASFAEESFIAGAEWYAKNQSEQMYSEEEVIRLLENYRYDLIYDEPVYNETTQEWFSQYKQS